MGRKCFVINGILWRKQEERDLIPGQEVVRWLWEKSQCIGPLLVKSGSVWHIPRSCHITVICSWWEFNHTLNLKFLIFSFFHSANFIYLFYWVIIVLLCCCNLYCTSVQISHGCCSVAQLCPTLCDHMDCNMPDSPVLH